MTESILTQVLLPAAIALIMLGMGLSLTVSDFTRLLRSPRPVVTGLVGQLALLPIIAIGLAYSFGLSAEFAMGLFIVAVCPGGTMSNVISQLCRANIALSVTLTAICTIIGIASTPLLIQLGYDHFLTGSAVQFSLLSASFGLLVLTLVPITLGMLINRYKPAWATFAEPFFRKGSAGFMVIMIIAIMIQERENLVESFSQLFFVCLCLNLLTIFAGLGLAKWQKLTPRDAITLGIEIGIQNATLAILIALTFLSQSALALPAGVYGLTMYIGAGVLIYLSRKLGTHKA